MRSGASFVKLATLGDAGSAHICAALLHSAGIEVRVHGEGLGPYPVTVGQMALTEIWVSEDDVEEATEVMLGAEVDFALTEENRRGAIADREALPMRLLSAILLVMVAAVVIRAVLRVF